MNHEVLKEMEKALKGNKTLQKLTLSSGNDVTLPKEFCRHLMIGIAWAKYIFVRSGPSFFPDNWDCPRDGRLVYVSHMLCDSVGCSV